MVSDTEEDFDWFTSHYKHFAGARPEDLEAITKAKKELWEKTIERACEKAASETEVSYYRYIKEILGFSTKYLVKGIKGTRTELEIVSGNIDELMRYVSEAIEYSGKVFRGELEQEFNTQNKPLDELLTRKMFDSYYQQRHYPNETSHPLQQ